MTPKEVASLALLNRKAVIHICHKTIPIADVQLIEDGYSEAILKILSDPDSVEKGDIFFTLTHLTVTWVSKYLNNKVSLIQHINGKRMPKSTINWKLLDPRFHRYCTETQLRVLYYKMGMISKKAALGNVPRNKDYVGATANAVFKKYRKWYKDITLFTKSRIDSVPIALHREILRLYKEGYKAKDIAKSLSINDNHAAVIIHIYKHRWMSKD